MSVTQRPWPRLAVTFAAIVLTGLAGFSLPRFGASIVLPLLPAGVACAAAWRWGRGVWPAVCLGNVVLDLARGAGPADALCAGAGAALGAVVFVEFLTRTRFDAQFGQARDVLLFVGATLLAMALAATVGLAAYGLGGGAASAGEPAFGVYWLRWFGNTCAGVLLLGPLLLPRASAALGRARESPLALVAYTLCVTLIALPMTLAHGPTFRGPVLVYAMVVVAAGAIRFGLAVGALAAFVVATVTAYSVAFGARLFVDVDAFDARVMLWSTIAAVSGLNLIIAALLAERDAAGAQRLLAERRYTTLFDENPQPLWVHDPARDRFLLVNDAALRQYGYTREQFLALSSAELATLGGGAALPGPEERASGEPYETRHATRDGRSLEVEVSTCSIDFAGQPAELVFAADVTERRALGRALVDAIAAEQRRIAQEMHDGLGQELTGLALSARALAVRARAEQPALAPGLDQLASLASACIRSAGEIVRGLSPLTGGDSLEDALEALARRSCVGGVRVSLHARLDAPLGMELPVRVHLYRIAQEALQNALKHSTATEIGIELWSRRHSVRLCVSDNGTGIGSGASRAGLGMRTMRFRASAIGATLRVTRNPEGGTSVVCEVPVAQPLAASA